MTKNIFDGRVETTLTTEKATSFKRNTIDIWKNYGYFKQQPCDFSIEKANLPENSILYNNQPYQSYKDNKKVLLTDYYLLGQVNQCLNPREDSKNYECKSNEAKFYRSKYHTVTFIFLGLYETLGYWSVRDGKGECFLDYSYSKENSKILYNHHNMRIANSFSCTMFNCHRIHFQSGALTLNFLKFTSFCPQSQTSQRVLIGIWAL